MKNRSYSFDYTFKTVKLTAFFDPSSKFCLVNQIYSSCQLWRNESVIQSPYSLDQMTQVLFPMVVVF